MTENRIEGAATFEYKTFLHEPGRPPSRGGNTSAVHRHVLSIDGADYSFFARGAQKWAFKGDSVSFDFTRVEKDGRVYFNVDQPSFVTTDGKGQPVIRGNRSHKAVLRTAQAK